MSHQRSFLTYLAQAVEQYRTDRQKRDIDEPPSLPRREQRILHWLIPNGGTLLIVAILLMTQSLWAKPSEAQNAPGPSATTVNYQGRLADDTGVPLTGTYGMSFALYDAATGGNLVWGPEHHTAVSVSEGLFSIGLGSQTSGGIPATTWNGDRYLEITVGGETLAPRELIRSVPIAGMALTVPDGAITQDQSPFAPTVYHQVYGGDLETVNKPIIWTGWFHGSSTGYATYDLSSIFTQVDAVMVMRARTSGGTNQQVTYMVTDGAGTDKPLPSEIKVWAYGLDGELVNWIQAYVVVIGR